MDKILTGGVSILIAVIGVAIIAVLVSNKSQTSQVISAGGTAFSGILSTALSPVSGTSNSGLPSLGSTGFMTAFQ